MAQADKQDLCCMLNSSFTCEGWCNRDLCADHVFNVPYLRETLSGQRPSTAWLCNECYHRFFQAKQIGALPSILDVATPESIQSFGELNKEND